jgi:hypothetical protein
MDLKPLTDKYFRGCPIAVSFLPPIYQNMVDYSILKYKLHEAQSVYNTIFDPENFIIDSKQAIIFRLFY